MPTVDLRPRAIDIKYRPGDAYDVRLNGPAGWLDGRAFEATFGGEALVVSEDEDALVVTVSDTLTAAHPVSGGAVEWVLSETGGNTVLVGSWKPSMQGSTTGQIDLDVSLSGLDIDVTLVVSPSGADMATQVELDAEIARATAAEAVLAADLVAEAALARNADNLTSGTVDDARIPSTIARDSEVTAAVAALAATLGTAATQSIETLSAAAIPQVVGIPGYGFGHSWMAADTYNTVGNRWWQQLVRRAQLGNFDNRGLSGSTSIEISNVIFGGGWTVGTKGMVFVHVGGNEQVNNDATNATVAATLLMELQSSITFLSAGTVVEAASMTAVGSWTNFGYVGASNGAYRYTTTANDTLTATVSGDKINVHYMTFDGVVFHGRIFEVRVDGVLKATVDPETLATNAQWGVAKSAGHGVLELTGLGAGSHSVEIKATASLGGGSGTPAYVAIDCIETPTTTPPLITLVVDPLISAYATAPERAAILTQAQAAAAGRTHVTIADIDTGWGGNTWLGADGVHPLDKAENHVANRVTAALISWFATNTTVPWVSAATTLAPVDVAVADGGTGASDAATARTNLGLGTMATQAASNVAITGGSVTGITDLAVADGGTGASTAAAALTNLGAVAQTSAPLLGQMLTSGEESFSRMLINGNAATGTGVLRLVYFTARKTETINNLRVITGSTAAAATPSLVRLGIFSIAANGDGTLVASTVNDTTLLAAANTAYTKALSSSWSKVTGQRYAFGLLVVTATTAPTMAGIATADFSPGGRNEFAIAPRLGGTFGSQTDIPASFTDAALTNGMQLIYAAMTP